MSKNFTLPLDLENSKHVEVFLRALEDERVRAGLRAGKSSLPIGVAEVISMVDDQEFLTTARSVAKQYAGYRSGKVEVRTVKKSGKKLYDYLNSKYPNGTKLLEDYSHSMMAANKLEMATKGWVAANTNAVANAEAAANAVVYINVAAATNVAVVLEAVAIVGVFVA